MDTQGRKIHLFMDVIELQMRDLILGLKFSSFQGLLQIQMLFLIYHNASLKFQMENLEQEELLFGKSLKLLIVLH